MEWSAQVRAEVTDDIELIALMRESNCFNVYIGFESFNPETLALYNKRIEVDRIRRSMDILHRHRSKVHGMFVLGSDADDAESVTPIHRAIELGVNFLDTSVSYGSGHNQELIGKALKGRRDDAIAVLDELTDGAQVLVGSSMGGWIMLLAALARPGRIHALVGVAAAPDFTEDLIPGDLSAEQKEQLQAQGFAIIPNCYDGEPYKITKELLDEGRNHLLLRGEIPLDCPVRLIHGTNDEDVPWQTSLKIAERLRSQDVETLFVKNGDHRLSESEDLNRLCRTVGRLLDQL